MRNALIIGLLVVLFSSFDYSYCMPNFINVRKPIYLVAESSFWSGCDNHPDGDSVCRALRVEQVLEGAREWFNYFDEADRPMVIFAYSTAEVPARTVNAPIYLKIEKDYCGFTEEKIAYPACYKNYFGSPPAIIFDLPEEIAPHIAHEFGHALGRKHNDMPEEAFSIMSYIQQAFHVLPIDIKIMCQTHTECPPMKYAP